MSSLSPGATERPLAQFCDRAVSRFFALHGGVRYKGCFPRRSKITSPTETGQPKRAALPPNQRRTMSCIVQLLSALRRALTAFPTPAIVAAVTLLMSGPAPANDQLHTLSRRIDAAINLQLEQAGVEPAAGVCDTTFARRATLDLAGRIPTTAELRDFLSCQSGKKREQLVDRLLASSDFAFHQRNELDMLLLARLQWDDRWRAYLLDATRENRPWDRVLREILLPEQEHPEDEGAAAYLRHRAKDVDALTNDTSSLLFGVNIACAKCHDHPLVIDWEQQHYFGMTAFFERTYPTRRGFVSERFDGDVQFTTISGEEKTASFMFLTGVTVDEPQVERDEEQWRQVRQQIKDAEKNDQAEPPPRPEFSPRRELIELALQDEHRYLARNIANRVWARLMGRGLVHPLDQMHSENPPSHPELLELLANELVEHKYDLQHLIRGIVLSDTYARSAHASRDDPLPAPELFAVRRPRPLTPHQLALSLAIASSNPDTLPGSEMPEDWEVTRKQWEQRAEPLARRFEIPTDQFQIPVEEALLLSNGQQIQNDFLADRNDRLVGLLKQTDEPQQLIDAAFLAVLSRYAEEAEREQVAAYLANRADRPVAGLQQFVWTLLTSAEFRFNH